MLSILIPVYNFEINQLVKDLYKQAIATGVVFEILCFDDGSEDHFRTKNKAICNFKQVIYKELPQNLGRSKIRNELAKAAGYDYLLFMDCDSQVVSPDYIRNYIKHLDPNTLLYGGRVYNSSPPSDSLLIFHWHYGINREQVDYKTRQQEPYHAFQTNNFLIPKDLFLKIQFDENLRQYGHEDTLFGFELLNRKIALRHIDNPLEHIGLETVDQFLEKTKKGIQNLLKLNDKYPFIETKLLRYYRFCQKSKLKYPIRWVYRLFYAVIERNLRSHQPNLRYFDFYKLAEMLGSSEDKSQ